MLTGYINTEGITHNDDRSEFLFRVSLPPNVRSVHIKEKNIHRKSRVDHRLRCIHRRNDKLAFSIDKSVTPMYKAE